MIYGANAIVSVYRLSLGTSTDTFPSTATLTGVEVYIESQSADLIQVLGDQQNNIDIFNMFVDPIDIQVGDKVIDDNSREYRVTGIEKHNRNSDTDDVYKVVLHSKKV